MGLKVNETLEDYKKYIKDNVNSKRYIHSLGVCYTAANLAMRYNYDLDKAMIAGILHDCAKGIEYDKLIKKCNTNGIKVSEADIKCPELLHSKYGAYLIEHKLNVKDKDIINAVYYHTTGRPNMTLLEKIIFISDYIEPSRNNLPQLDEIRYEAYLNIDKAIAMICNGSIQYLKSKGSLIDEATIDTYNFYKS